MTTDERKRIDRLVDELDPQELAEVINDVTNAQHLENAKESARHLDRDGLGHLAAFIATELGAMKMADEFRESCESGNTRGRFDNKFTPFYDGLPHSNS
jgi:hypothetical protein